MKIYLAGGIFTIGDELRNTLWAKRIRDALPGVDLYSPIENTDINVNHINNLSWTALLEVTILGNDSINYQEIILEKTLTS